MRNVTLVLAAALALSACNSAGGQPGPGGNGNGNGDGSGNGGGAVPLTVSGRVLDERGNPVSGAVIITEPSMYRGTIFTRTGADGRYRSVELNQQTAPYESAAYKEVTYHGRKYCVRLAGETGAEYDAYNPRDGVVLNWRWKMTGASNYGDDVWGGTLKFEPVAQTTDDPIYVAHDEELEVTFVPDGPLIDGSAGQTIVKTGTRQQAFADVPVGKYTVSAKLVGDNGAKTPLRLNTEYSEDGLAGEATLLFRGFENCGHTGTFVSTVLFIAR